jgi:hypothetical protein
MAQSGSGCPILSSAVLPRMADHDWTDLSQFYVDLHENCEVTTAPGLRTVGIPSGRTAHHVYAAAFNFSANVAFCKVRRRTSGQMLGAEYQATVTAGWAIGGGVFGNSREIIVLAKS